MTIKERNKERFVSYPYERVILKSFLLTFPHAWFNRKNRSKGKGGEKRGGPLAFQQPNCGARPRDRSCLRHRMRPMHTVGACRLKSWMKTTD